MASLLLTEGIILRATPFRDRDCIATLFSPEHGILSLVVKRSPSFCAPLYRVEASYYEGKGELHRCHELSLLNAYNSLRKELPRLQLACDLLKVIQMTQREGQPAPHLYQLLLYFLDRIPDADNLSFFSSSFRLKVLNYEGLIALPLSPSMSKGHFSDAEYDQIFQLSTERCYAKLASIQLSVDLQERIIGFFEAHFKD